MSRRLLLSLALAMPALRLAAAEAPFSDDFDDNRHKWSKVEETPKWTGQIEKGRFLCENLDPEKNTMRRVTQSIKVDANRSFEVSLRLRFEPGPKDSGAALVIPARSEGKAARQFFEFSADGFFKIYGTVGDKFPTVRKWTPLPQLTEKRDHEFTIRIVDRVLYYFINGAAVDVADFTGLDGDEFGWSVDSGTTVSVDHFHVKYLEEKPDAFAASARQWARDAQAFMIAAGPKPIPFLETFDDNRREWPFLRDDPTWSAKIESGELIWQNKKTERSKQRAGVTVPISDASDYDLRFRVRHVAGPRDDIFGLTWADDDKSLGALEAGFAADGHYVLAGFYDGEYRKITGWRQSTLIKKGTHNELRVRKLGRTIFLFVNGQVVTDTPAYPLRGKELEIVVSEGITAAYDEIRLEYPQLTPEQTEQERATIIAALKTAHEQKGLGAVYSVSARLELIAQQNARERAAMGLDEPTLTDRDDKAVQKLRRQWMSKSMLSLLATWKRPAREQDKRTLIHLYYPYKMIGRTQFYYQFELQYSGAVTSGKPLDPKLFLVSNVNILSEGAMRRIYGVQ